MAVSYLGMFIEKQKSIEFFLNLCAILQLSLLLNVDIVKVDALAKQKISKHHFFKDIEKSFHEVTHIDLETHQFSSFENMSTNTVARDVQNFGQSDRQAFFANLIRN